MEKKDVANLIPNQVWFTLKEVCELKNLSYKTSCNQKQLLQPNRGVADAKIGGRKMFRRDTVLDWVLKSDEQLAADNERGRK